MCVCVWFVLYLQFLCFFCCFLEKAWIIEIFMQACIGCILCVIVLDSKFLYIKMKSFLIKSSGNCKIRETKMEEQVKLRLNQETRFKGATMYLCIKSAHCTF